MRRVSLAILTLALLLAGATPVRAQVVLDAAGTQQVNDGGGVDTTYTGLTVGAGANRALVLVVACASDPGAITVNRWDDGASNQNLTSVVAPVAGVNGQRVAIYGLVAPTSGAKTLQYTWTNVTECVINAAAWTGVDQTGGATSFPNSASAGGNTTTPTITGTLPASGATMSICVAGTLAGVTAVTATQFVLYHGIGAIEAGGSRSTATATLTCTLDGTDQWRIAITGIAAAAGGGAAVARAHLIGVAP